MTAWDPSLQVILLVAVLGLVGKEIAGLIVPRLPWNKVQEARKEVIRKEVDSRMDSESSDVLRAQEVRDAILAKDHQGRLLIHNWGMADLLAQQSHILSNLVDKVHKSNGVMQGLSTRVERVESAVHR